MRNQVDDAERSVPRLPEDRQARSAQAQAAMKRQGVPLSVWLLVFVGLLLLPRQGPRAVRAIPGARLVTLRGCGHVPTYDDPRLVAEVLLAGSRPGRPCWRRSSPRSTAC